MPINLDQEIQKVDAEILALRGTLPALETSYREWFKQSQVPCTQYLKSKRDECSADKQFKLNKALSAQTQINSINLEINNKQKYRESLLSQKASENKQAEILASQGMSQSALLVKANAEAEAIKNIAEAQAKTVTDSSESTNQRKNIIIAVVLIVLVIAGVVLYKKLKKKK